MEKKCAIVGLCLLFSLLFTGCDGFEEDPGGLLGPGSWRLTLTHDENLRTLFIHIPSTYKKETPVPLLLSFHGYQDTPMGQAKKDRFGLLSETENFIVAYPEGTGAPGLLGWNAGPACCGLAEDRKTDDVGFARLIVETVTERCTIDHTQVYAHGHSNGGGLAHRLGREASDLFAAISATSMPVLVPETTPHHPTSAIHFHGLEDTTIAFDGGKIPFEEEAYISAKESFSSWSEKNGCLGNPIFSETEKSWSLLLSKCDENTSVALYALKGAGHHNIYDHDEIDVSKTAWNFLSRFQK